MPVGPQQHGLDALPLRTGRCVHGRRARDIERRGESSEPFRELATCHVEQHKPHLSKQAEHVRYRRIGKGEVRHSAPNQ